MNKIAKKPLIRPVEKWYKQSHRPEADPKEPREFSISVLLYSPSLGIWSIGWFDFEMDCWQHIADEAMEDFIWTYLPEPPKS